MKKIADKLKSGSFWVAVAGAVTLLFARFFGITESAEIIADTVGAILLLFGIVLPPATKEEDDGAEDLTDECDLNDGKEQTAEDGNSPDGESK